MHAAERRNAFDERKKYIEGKVAKLKLKRISKNAISCHAFIFIKEIFIEDIILLKKFVNKLLIFFILLDT